MNAQEVLDAVRDVGGLLEVIGQRIQYELPQTAVWLVPKIKEHREELRGLLRNGGIPPTMPPGVRLLKWEPKDPPVAIMNLSVVNNVDRFVAATLLQLRARLEGKDFLAGNWSLRELIDRLELVGVTVTVESTSLHGRGDGRTI